MAATRLVRLFGGARRVLTVLAIMAVCGLIAATAYAAIPDAIGTFNGCVSKLTGVLRVIDPSKGGTCATGHGLLQETPITWSQRGPQGPQGPPGPPGPSGGLTSLDQLSGLPCNVNSPDHGTVKIEYDQPVDGSGIHLYCRSGKSFLTVQIPRFYYYTNPDHSLAFIGTGRVTANPPGAVCDGNSTDSELVTCPPIPYVDGTVVTLTAVPNEGSRFGGWGGACLGETTLTCTVTVDRNMSVDAQFPRAS